MWVLVPLVLYITFATANYGIDYSFPITAWDLKIDGPFSGKQEMYDNFLVGCRANNPPRFEGDTRDRCKDFESDRLEMNKHQPKAMLNYTSAGYAKVKAPKEAMKLLTDFWNEHKDEQTRESWESANTYVNHWEQDTFFLQIPSDDIDGEGAMSDKIFDLVYPVVSNWIGGLELTATSLYGIRVYKAGAVLAPHVDRLPLVTSAIINVAQTVDEAWPLEVYGHDGIARNMTLEPGEMILYESHTVIHGRPFPMMGNESSFYANVFIHFEPVGHTERHSQSGAWGADMEETEETEFMYNEALQNGNTGLLDSSKQEPKELPDYIEASSAEGTMWRQSYVYSPDVNNKHAPDKKHKIMTEPEGMTPHTAAATGKLHVLKAMHGRKPELLHKQDENGWTPMHEAARGGQREVLEYLVKSGASVNGRTNDGRGATPLWWAEFVFDANHPAVRFLREHNALNLGPEL